jgi:hypothetical protein
MGMSPPRDNTHKLKRSRTTSARDRWRLWRESSPPLPGPFFVWAFYYFAAVMPRTGEGQLIGTNALRITSASNRRLQRSSSREYPRAHNGDFFAFPLDQSRANHNEGL